MCVCRWALEIFKRNRVIRRRHTKGISLTADEKFNLVTSYGTIKGCAEMEVSALGICSLGT